MKKILLLLFVFPAFIISAQPSNPKYDRALADSLGADEYGMKMYTLVILKTGTNQTASFALLDSLFTGHMANIARLVESGKLVVAGPIMKNEKNYRGIFILDVSTSEEALALLSTDPAIREKLLEAELFQWYGSAALPQYLESHEKIEQMKH